MNYDQFRRNVHSQNGEDGILEKLFEVLNITSGYVAEVGAHDGIEISNTYNVFKNNKNFIPILIEGDPKRVARLENNLAHISEKHVVTRYIDIDENRLDNIFDSLDLPSLHENFQFLSIDIDGNDYGVWKTLINYRPKIILIEADSFALPEIVKCDIVTGASAAALVMLGQQKGYELITHCGNVFFVVKELFDKLEIEDNSLKKVFDYSWVQGRI
tara:strand:- start:13060 stop:13704 length:645 start_codon:yes stop_codon:yes gene_type:complete